jgi:DNA-binding MarR family transcriptional regulator
MKQRIALSVYESLVIQQVEECGSEDINSLSTELSIERRKLLQIVAHLKQKGLIQVRTAATDTWVELSSKGQRLARNLWPASPQLGGAAL